MLYEFPAEWTLNGAGTHGNDKLSELDELFAKSEKMYPGKATPESKAVDLAVAASIQASISGDGEVDLYKFEVTEAGPHTIQTMGPTDVFMSLFGPDSKTVLVADDDDGGTGRNSLISAELQSGTYYVQIRHYNDQQTEDYRVLVHR